MEPLIEKKMFGTPNFSAYISETIGIQKKYASDKSFSKFNLVYIRVCLKLLSQISGKLVFNASLCNIWFANQVLNFGSFTNNFD